MVSIHCTQVFIDTPCPGIDTAEHRHEEFPGKILKCHFYGHPLNASTENVVIGHGNLIIHGKHKSCVLKIYIFLKIKLSS